MVMLKPGLRPWHRKPGTDGPEEEHQPIRTRRLPVSSVKRATSKWCSPGEGGPAPLLALGGRSLAAAHPEMAALGH